MSFSTRLRKFWDFQTMFYFDFFHSARRSERRPQRKQLWLRSHPRYDFTEKNFRGNSFENLKTFLDFPAQNKDYSKKKNKNKISKRLVK